MATSPRKRRRERPDGCWRSPRRRCHMTDRLGGVLHLALAGADYASRRDARATCTALKRALETKGLAAARRGDGVAHVVRALPRTAALVNVEAVLADNQHLQLDGNRVDVASLAGSWDQYVVAPVNWRAPWPESRRRVLALKGVALDQLRQYLSHRWAGVREVEATAGQMYVDEGASIRLEYAPRGLAGVLVGVEVLSSRWTLSAEMRAERAISEHDEASDAPRLRVYARRPAAKGNLVTTFDLDGPDGFVEGPAGTAERLAPLPGRTRVASQRSTYAADDFGPARWSDDDEDVDGTWVYTVTHSLREPLALSDKNVVVEIDCREHDCNAAVHNVFLLVAY